MQFTFHPDSLKTLTICVVLNTDCVRNQFNKDAPFFNKIIRNHKQLYFCLLSTPDQFGDYYKYIDNRNVLKLQNIDNIWPEERIESGSYKTGQ